MKLIYTDGPKKGELVKVGDEVRTSHRNKATVTFFREPHKPESEGKVSIKNGKTGCEQELYVSVIGAEWIDREDREPLVKENKTDMIIIARASYIVRPRVAIELAIVRKLIECLRANSFDLYGDNGEDNPEKLDNDDELIECLFSVDEARILTADRNREHFRSFVFLVFGNDGWDVIADYGVSLDYVLNPLYTWIEKTYPH